MRVLVTGGAGFIGSHIVEGLLQSGHDPFVFDDLSTGRLENVPRDVPVIEADVCDAGAVRETFLDVQPHAVCLQAAQMSVSRSVDAPAFDARVNVVGLLNVLEEAARGGVQRVVFASSGGCLYGDVDVPATEEAPCRPISPYGISKWAGEQYLRFFNRMNQIPTVALRYANVYGPRQNPHGEAGVIAIFCRRMLGGEPARIHGDGSCRRDYVHVRDVARANVLALTNDLPREFLAFNVGTGIGTDVTTLERELRAFFGPVVPRPEHGPSRRGDLQSSVIDPSRAGAILGWRPSVRLSDGLNETVRWFAEQVRDEREHDAVRPADRPPAAAPRQAGAAG